MTVDALEKARRLLREETPLSFDCGRRCGAACCQGGEQDGMLLFPGEERYYEDCGWAKVLPDKLGYRLVCQGRCQRENRPLSCRIFPLVMHARRQEDGGLKANISMDVRAWPVCPLMHSKKRGLRMEFVKAVQEAAALLWAEDKQRTFFILMMQELDAYEQMKRTFLAGRDG